MGVSVAEYLGKRTDIDNPVIVPVHVETDKDRRRILKQQGAIPGCPFVCGNMCKKIASGNEPVCSVRKPDGTLWLNCSERLCATKSGIPLSEYQSEILLQVGKYIYNQSVTREQICVKREARLSVIERTDYNADFIIALQGGNQHSSGPERLVLEMQGGGETTNTGEMTAHIRRWKAAPSPTNEYLRRATAASTLEANAWRRQQEQFIVKGNIAMKTLRGCGIAFCVGTLLFDYLMGKLASAHLPDLREHNWTLALIGFKEDTSGTRQDSSISLIVDEDRLLYTNYQTFVQALINQGEPTPNAFRGDFINLNNQPVTFD